MYFIKPGKHCLVSLLFRPNFVISLFVLCAFCTSAYAQHEQIRFTVSMKNPSTHYFHVEMECKGFEADTLEFKMPAWTPGYYWIMNFAKNVTNFAVLDDAGKRLSWDKTDKNKWEVIKGRKTNLTISYDVYANTRSVADPFLDDSHAYISTAGLFIYPVGYLQHDAFVTIKPYHNWSAVSTGLEPVKDQPFTFYASNFDELFDCPIYAGNQQVSSFYVRSIPHYVAFENPGNFDTARLLNDLKKMVESASSLIGEIPYKHYTFLIMGEGRGGLEHINSTAVFSSGTVYGQADAEAYKRWLAFLAHEYFHHYNIKRIRPIVLGPFDYDKENLTHMLWVSEGFTVYYEYIVLNRAGLMSKEDVYKALQSNIKNYENIPGHLFQSATQASYDTWIQFFSRGDNASNTTISYYDKGCVLGALLDIAIRHETNNAKSLDDVMRTLYNLFYKEKRRGFTDEEFRKLCESVAGKELPEIFAYASTTEAVDYKKYFAWAGLDIDTSIKSPGNTWIGAFFQQKNNQVVISGIEWDTPAWKAGLSVNDVVQKVGAITVTQPTELEKILNGKIPGDSVELTMLRKDKEMKFTVPLALKTERSFEIKPIAGSREPFNNWLH